MVYLYTAMAEDICFDYFVKLKIGMIGIKKLALTHLQYFRANEDHELAPLEVK